MMIGQMYEVITEIKLHTKPLKTAKLIRTGVFIKETNKTFVFDTFVTHKDTVIEMNEVK